VASLGDEVVLDGGGLVEHVGATAGVEGRWVRGGAGVKRFGGADDVGGVGMRWASRSRLWVSDRSHWTMRSAALAGRE